ncbi:nucleotidyltransferase domain-containing protein [Sporosarcina sp. Te-1]|uniref:nucleotidyltransferase domain-containing protein n=1 Tax=Sporosarcina sp. Te-1 TaxID=2818390 RepID=UPI001A9F9B4E|nr:nucleotidyltransferase domain-containing protein [Sporosarcina sp. Te-1]QTD41862.1 nucleotidyltransferase domain-containing protein [Sporosarcina sp. Te-1]
MDSRISVSVQNVLNDYLSLCQEYIPETVVGLYIHGSIALGAYQEGSSDIDFMTVVNRPLGEDEVQAISHIHREVKRKQNIEMDGSYLVEEDVGRHWNDISECVYVNGGKAIRSKHEMNPVTWWMMKNRGICVTGPDISSLPIEVDEKELTSYVLRNMNRYWAGRINTLKKYKRIAVFLPNRLIEQELLWSVPGVLRQFYTLQERAITSKAEVCTYALDHVPERWHPIITEVISMRDGGGTGYGKAKKQKIDDLLQLMVYIITYCNEKYKD